jgi:hypothetical protein
MNPVHSIIIFLSYLRVSLLSDLFSSGFLIKSLHALPFPHMRATRRVHIILLDIIIIITFDEEYKLWSSPLCNFLQPSTISRSRDSVVDIATGYGLEDRGVRVRIPVGSRIFSSPRRPDRLWGPPSLLSNGYGGPFPRGKAAGA